MTKILGSGHAESKENIKFAVLNINFELHGRKKQLNSSRIPAEKHVCIQLYFLGKVLTKKGLRFL